MSSVATQHWQAASPEHGIPTAGSAALAVVLESAWQGLLIVLSWPNIVYPIAGTLLAMMFAFFPGLSGVTLMALAIPWTFSWDVVPTVLLFGALVGGATFMGSITAILFNIPGTAPNAATMLDGYPMAQQGRARTAIACSASASALGSTVGVILLIALIPIVRRIVLAVGPLEMLLLAAWGLSTIALVSRRSILKGLIAAGLGLVVGLVGLDPRTAEPRYTFGAEYLLDGVPIVPAFLGLFALAEMINLFTSGRRRIAGEGVDPSGGSAVEGLLTAIRHPRVFLSSSALGMLIGTIPGVGGTVASFVAYGETARAHPSGRFGEGDVRGVLAPESANDAKDAGSLLPVLAFGIPGSEGTVLLLAALTLHGVVPGRELLEGQLTLVFVLIWSLFFSNWLTSLLGLAASRKLARFTVVPAQVLVPFILVLVMLAALAYRASFEDVLLAAGFGLFGYWMKVHGWPRVAFVIALVLASLFETNLHLTVRLMELERLDPLQRPLSLALVAMLVATHAWPLLQHVRRSRSAATE
jgi:putative tricarboxylic transport membrane protein